MCQDRYQPDPSLRETSESTDQTEAAQLSQHTARPGSRIKATVSANKTLSPAGRASRGAEAACSLRPHQPERGAQQSARGSGPCFIAFILITQSLNKIKVLIPSSCPRGSCCALGCFWCHEASQAATTEGTSLTARHGSTSHIGAAPRCPNSPDDAPPSARPSAPP